MGECMVHDVIQVDFRSLWRVPVFVRGEEGTIFTIRGPEDALRNLHTMDLSYESTSQRRAKAKCLSALIKTISPDEAREAFVDACYETGKLV
jgi:hypothetical protein